MAKRNHIALRLLLLSLVLSVGVGIFCETALTKPGEVGVQNKAQTSPSRAEQARNNSAIDLKVNDDGNPLETPRTGVEEPKDAAARSFEQIYDKFALLGTVVGDKKYALAIIEDKERQTQTVFKIGEPIFGGFITDILKDKIIIQLDGESFVFSIGGGANSRKEEVAPRLDEESKLINVSLRDVQVAISDLVLARSKARMVPLSSDLEMGAGGMQLLNLEPGSVFQKMGFKNGDVIEEINGNPIGDPFNAVAIYNLMKEVIPVDVFQESGLDLGNFLNGTDNQKAVILQKVQRLLSLFQKKMGASLTLTVKRKGNPT
jgi:type II secretory pathway component PulC